MKKSIFTKTGAILVIMLLFIAAFTIPASTAIFEPNKDTDGYYLITNAQELVWLTSRVSSGIRNINVRLTEDIDLNPGCTFAFDADSGLVSVTKEGVETVYLGTGIRGDFSGQNTTFDGETASTAGAFYSLYADNEFHETEDAPDLSVWIPIGSENGSYQYTGNFDGNGHTVSGLYVNNGIKDNVGLFGFISSASSVRGVTVANSYFYGQDSVGGVCGDNNGGAISGCSNSGTVVGVNDVGGVCGNNTGIINGCYSIGTVAGYSYIGGVCGSNNNTVTNCCYLLNCAPVGIGNTEYDTAGEAEGKSEYEFSSGSVAYALNGNRTEGTAENPLYWYQNLTGEDADLFPTSDVSHATVYVSEYDENGFVVKSASVTEAWDYTNSAYQPASQNSDGYYEIGNAGNLYWFASQVNAGDVYINAKLTDNIYLNRNYGLSMYGVMPYIEYYDPDSGEPNSIGRIDHDGGIVYYNENQTLREWTPIGCDDSHCYQGTFDGNGKFIDLMCMSSSSQSNGGLFGYVGNDAEIYKTILDNVLICGNRGNGGLCADNNGRITDCAVIGAVIGEENFSLCTTNNGVLQNCYFYSLLVFTENRPFTMTGDVDNCYYLDYIGVDESAYAKSQTEFANGSVTWLLNGSTPDGVWKQDLSDITGQFYPWLSGDYTVYNVGYNEEGFEGGYSNSATLSGAYEPAVLIAEDNYSFFEYELSDPHAYIGYYAIKNAGNLFWFSEFVNMGNSNTNAVLTSDINLNPNFTFERNGNDVNISYSDEGVSTVIGRIDSSNNIIWDYTTHSLREWIPIGTQSEQYNGLFDGNKFYINGLYYYDRLYSGCTGMFGYTGTSARIEKFILINSLFYMDNSVTVGAICGYNTGTIKNCGVSCIIRGHSYNGYLCGYNTGRVTNCFSDALNQQLFEATGRDSYISNCYYPADSSTTDGGITVEYFWRGAATWYLNRGQSEVVWKQDLLFGEDSYGNPTFRDDGTVYAYYDSNGFAAFTNDSSMASTIDGVYQSGVPNDNGTVETADDYYELSNVGNLYWFALQVKTQNTGCSVKLKNDINLNYGYTFSFIADTGLVEVTKDGITFYIGTGIMGDTSGTDVAFDTEPSADGSIYSKNDDDVMSLASALSIWTPIGDDSGSGSYTGTFDGGGFTVSGLYYNSNENNRYIGLFGVIGNTSAGGGTVGTVKNLTIANSYICGSKSHDSMSVGSICGYNTGMLTGCNNSGIVINRYLYVGGVCGQNEGTLNDCINNGTVDGIDNVGGVCGQNEGTLTGCINNGTVNGMDSVGGVCGRNDTGNAEITDCRNTADVTGQMRVGGVCASNDGSITDCNNSGKVDGNTGVGGVCGQNEGTLTGCTNDGTVQGDTSTGGICGYNYNSDAEITDCRNNADVTGQMYVGGVCASNDGSIGSCSNSGRVTGNYEVAGVCGYNSETDASLTDCYNIGTVYGSDYIGGICGASKNGTKITSCYNIGIIDGEYISENRIGSICGYFYTTATATNCYYLGNTETDSNIGTTYKTAAQFADGSVAWLLNTAGKNDGDDGYSHSRVWSQGRETDYPIFANDTDKAIYRISISGAKTAVYYTDNEGKCKALETVHVSNASDISKETVHAADVSYTVDTAITSAQPSLGSSITLVYEASIQTTLIGGSKPQMVFTYHGQTFTVDGTAGTPVGDYTPYTFAFTNIAPQCMGDAVDASLTVDGRRATKSGYSLKIYCDKMLAKSDADLAAILVGTPTATVPELKKLLGDILLYGAASQRYTGYKTDALVGDLGKLLFDDLTETDKLVVGPKNDNAFFTAAGLWFESINKIYWKIAISDENLAKLTVNVYRDGVATPCGTLPVKFSDGVYIVYSEAVTAADFAAKYTATITYDGAQAQSVTYSVNSYVFAKQGETTPIGTLARALCNYGKSAVDYTTAGPD